MFGLEGRFATETFQVLPHLFNGALAALVGQLGRKAGGPVGIILRGCGGAAPCGVWTPRAAQRGQTPRAGARRADFVRDGFTG